MPVPSPQQCLQTLRVLYRDAFKVRDFDDTQVINWANSPELWAEHKIRHAEWSFYAAEAVVRNCRRLRKRAAIAVHAAALAPAGADAFDPLMPESCTPTEEASSDDL
jgi:hypothetical protein